MDITTLYYKLLNVLPRLIARGAFGRRIARAWCERAGYFLVPKDDWHAMTSSNWVETTEEIQNA